MGSDMSRRILALVALAGFVVAMPGCESVLRPYKAPDRDPNAGGGSSMYRPIEGGRTW
jgi:hypothetical protein